MLPVLTYTLPRARPRDALRWRHATLDRGAASARAQLGLEGAAFPWRTIARRGVLGLLAGGHRRVPRQRRHRRRRRPLRRRDRRRRTSSATSGCELLVETARLWRSLGHHDADGGFRIDGVTGPDEYSAVADNNVYTNLMAQRNLLRRRRRGRAPARSAPAALGVDDEEAAAWRDAADAMTIPYDERPRRPPAVRGLHRPRALGLRATPPETLPAAAALPVLRPLPQAGRQAGRPRARAVRCAATRSRAEEKARNFAYYEALTVRDSSLSACTQAVIAAEVGHLDLAYDYLGRGRADGPRRPRAQHPRRPAHRVAGGRLDRRRRRLRRHARPRRRAVASAPAARAARPAALPARLPRPACSRSR